MSFNAELVLVNVYTLNDNSLSLIDKTFVIDFDDIRNDINKENARDFLQYDTDIVFYKDDQVVVEYVRKVEFFVYKDDYNSIFFQEIDGKLRITEDSDKRLYETLKSLLTREITLMFCSDSDE